MKTATASSRCSPPRSGCGVRAAAGQSDRGAGQPALARRIRGADVGLQLRRGRGRLDCDLRQAESGGDRLVAGGDHRSHGPGPQINLTNNLSFRRDAEQNADFAGDRRPVGRRPREHGADDRHPARSHQCAASVRGRSQRPRTDRRGTPPPRDRACSRSPPKWPRERPQR